MSDQTQNPQNEEVLESTEATSSQDTGINSQNESIPTNDSDEIGRLKASLARAQADYQNLQMRVERDKADMVYFLSAKLLLPLLKEVDNLERAVKLKEGVDGDAFVDGVRSVFGGMTKYLESQWVKSFVSVGQEVDPERHDVMTEGPGESGKITQEFEKGYTLGDRVLRHAKVVVGNGQ